MKITVTRRKEPGPIIEACALVEPVYLVSDSYPRPVILVTTWPQNGCSFSGVVVVPSIEPFTLGRHSAEWTKDLYRVFRGTVVLDQ